MVFRVNYNQQRADRNRVKEQRKLERLARREGDKGEVDPITGEPVSEGLTSDEPAESTPDTDPDLSGDDRPVPVVDTAPLA